MLFNGDLVQSATSLDKDGFLDQVMVANRKNQDRINALYVAALSRWPSPIELRYANQLLLARQGQVKEALQDVWWALLNSNEFILNHKAYIPRLGQFAKAGIQSRGQFWNAVDSHEHQ